MAKGPPSNDPATVLQPADDGAADHLEGRSVPGLRLKSTTEAEIDLGSAAKDTLVVYAYPRTAVPGEPLPPGWMQIPGAFGCTAENCAFRDHSARLAQMGVTLVGLSAQPLAQQRDFASSQGIRYPLVNDSALVLADSLGLPTFEVAGMRLYRRLTFVAHKGRIVKRFYPVFPPDGHAAQVENWLESFLDNGSAEVQSA